MTFDLIFFLIIIVAPFSAIVHELGHVIGAYIVSSHKLRAMIGLGKKIFTISYKNIMIHFHIIIFIGGAITYERKKPYKNKELILITILGPLNNLLFAIIFYSIYLFFPNNYFYLLSIFNLWLAVINLIPFKISGRSSDGHMIYNLLAIK